MIEGEIMSDKNITMQDFRPVVDKLVKMALTARIEVLALEAVLQNRGGLIPEELRAMTARFHEEITERSIRELDEATDDDFLDIVRRL